MNNSGLNNKNIYFKSTNRNIESSELLQLRKNIKQTNSHKKGRKGKDKTTCSTETRQRRYGRTKTKQRDLQSTYAHIMSSSVETIAARNNKRVRTVKQSVPLQEVSEYKIKQEVKTRQWPQQKSAFSLWQMQPLYILIYTYICSELGKVLNIINDSFSSK